MQDAQLGPLATLPALPTSTDAAVTADYIRDVMEGRLPPPEPILLQVEHIVRACKALEAEGDPTCLQELAA